MESFLQAVYRTVRTALLAGTPIWGDRVYLRYASKAAAKPYAIVSFVSGAEKNEIRQVDPELTLQIKTVADEYLDALQGEADIADRINDRGTQDDAGLGTLDAGANWEILTATRGQIIDVLEIVDGVTPLFHVGAQYRLVLGEK